MMLQFVAVLTPPLNLCCINVFSCCINVFLCNCCLELEEAVLP